ncbi:hypothetical protein cym2001_39160 [Pseudomonas sp. CYM-20-01]|nr:hypothetical protein cym2001_39160 [Pseudomonas sp. CYM-20-01]
MGLASVEGGGQVGEMAGEGGAILNGMGEVGQGLDHGVGLTVIEVLPLMGSGFFVACTGLIGSKRPPTLDRVDPVGMGSMWEGACPR